MKKRILIFVGAILLAISLTGAALYAGNDPNQGEGFKGTCTLNSSSICSVHCTICGAEHFPPYTIWGTGNITSGYCDACGATHPNN